MARPRKLCEACAGKETTDKPCAVCHVRALARRHYEKTREHNLAFKACQRRGIDTAAVEHLRKTTPHYPAGTIGPCGKCGGPREGGRACVPCTSARLQKYYVEVREGRCETTLQERKRSGLCIRCGKTPPRDGVTTCATCARDLREDSLLKKYGVSLAEYDARYIAQGSRCAICSRKFKKLFIDHDHKTEKVRGLLCHSCNVAIGLFQEVPGRLESAIRYLTQHAPEEDAHGVDSLGFGAPCSDLKGAQ